MYIASVIFAVARPMTLKRNLALFFMMFFMLIISAPTIIISIDSSHDTSILFDFNEEEEKEGVKLLLEYTSQELDYCFFDKNNSDCANYTFKKYTRPHLNLVFPPPDFT